MVKVADTPNRYKIRVEVVGTNFDGSKMDSWLEFEADEFTIDENMRWPVTKRTKAQPPMSRNTVTIDLRGNVKVRRDGDAL